MKKKLTACMAAACLAATAVGASVALTGCGGGGDKFPTKDSDPTADINILFLANNAEEDFYKEYFHDLQEKTYNNQFKINFRSVGASEYYGKLNTEMTGGNVPDIFYVRPNEIMKYHDDIFCLEEFKNTIGKEESNFINEDLKYLNLNDIYPLALDLYKYNDDTNKLDVNGELYAFPKDLSTQQLGYNKKIVAQYENEIHGANLPLPWELGRGMYETKVNYTWKEYREMCEIIAEASDKNNNGHYASDVPDIEILASSFGASLLNTTTMKVDVTSENMQKAINLQHELVTPSGNHGNYAAANFMYATQANFKRGEVAFYGAVGSWEVGTYDDAPEIGKGNWGLMAWPTTDGSLNWKGKLTSAGYVVSNKCKNWQAAMEIAASFMTSKVQQQMVGEKKISIPMNKTLENDYLNPANDNQYSPATRSIFIDVIKGDHGFRPAEYYTFAADWMRPLTNELQKLWVNESYTIDAALQRMMQQELDSQ